MADEPIADESVADEPRVSGGTNTSGGRSWVPTAIVILATLIAVLSAATTWVRVQALDTDAWVDASSELLEEPEVQAALATYLVEELYAAVDVTAEFQAALPEDLSGIAGPLAGALRGPAINGVERVLDRPRLQSAWEEANRLAHETFVAIVRNETRDNVSTADGTVELDLGAAVVAVGQDLGLPDAALDRIPDDLGQITVVQSDDLANLQDAVRVLDVLSWFLFLVVVVLYALAVYLARERRRETLRNIGFALVAGGVAILALRSVSVRAAVDTIVDDPTNRPIGRLVGDVFTQLLSDMATTSMIIGLLIVLYAMLLGPHRWALAIRRRLGEAERPGLIIALFAVGLVVVLVWWSPGLVFERWITALTLLAMIAGAAIALTSSLGSDTLVADVDGPGPQADMDRT